MTWIQRNRHWVLLALFAATSVALVGVPATGAVVLLAGLVGGASLAAVVADAAALLGLVTTLLVVDVVLAVALVVTVVRRASLPTSERLADLCELVESLFPPARPLALSRRFRPSLAERTARLKRRYVDGDLAEAAFEREMDALLADTEPLGSVAGRTTGAPSDRVADDERTRPGGRRAPRRRERE